MGEGLKRAKKAAAKTRQRPKPRPEPGLWDIKGNEVRQYGRGTIAVVPGPAEGGTFDCFSNRWLIAAAPEMLAALKTFVGIADDTEEINAGRWAAAVVMARAAIARATTAD